MKVNNKGDIFKVGNILADIVDLWMHPFVGIHPLSIQIKSCEICSKVAIDNSIRIDHWYENNLEASQHFLFFQ
jgi:hypothetical protein